MTRPLASSENTFAQNQRLYENAIAAAHAHRDLLSYITANTNYNGYEDHKPQKDIWDKGVEDFFVGLLHSLRLDVTEVDDAMSREEVLDFLNDVIARWSAEDRLVDDIKDLVAISIVQLDRERANALAELAELDAELIDARHLQNESAPGDPT